jgi:hypothetical protein
LLNFGHNFRFTEAAPEEKANRRREHALNTINSSKN